MTATSTGAGGGPARRRAAFVEERLLGAGPAGLRAGPGEEPRDVVVHAEIEHRAEQVARFARARQGGAAGLVASATGPNWVPIGPAGVVDGQAATRPVVSGRVQDVAVAGEGQRVYLATAEGGVWRSLDAGLSWEAMTDALDLMETGPSPLPVTALATSLSTGAIALAEGGDAAGDRLYVGTGEAQAGVAAAPDLFGVGMLRSDDGGRTWLPEGSTPSLAGAGVFELALDPDDREHVLAATQTGLYRRTAATAGTPTPWRREALPGAGAGARVSSVVAGRLAGATAFWAATYGGTVARWTAAGGWTALPALPSGAPSPGAPDRVTLAASGGPSSVVYALADRATGHHLHGVHRFDAPSGTWWTLTGAPERLFGPDPAKTGQGWYDQALVVDPTDPLVLHVGGSTVEVAGEWSGAVYRLAVTLTATGASCTSTLTGGSVHGDVHALVMRPGSADELWVGCDGGVFVSRSARASGNDVFTSCNTGLSVLTLTGLAHLPGEDSWAFAGAQDNGGLRYTGSEVWEHQLPGDGGATVVDFRGRDRLLDVYTSTTVRRARLAAGRYDYGEVSPVGVAGSLFYPPLEGAPPAFAAGDPVTPVNPGDADVVAIGSDRPWVSTRFGDDWRALPQRTPPPAAQVFVRALAFSSPSLLWAGWTDGHVARYDLLATGWVCTDAPRAGETRPVTSFSVDPAVPGGEAVYLTFGGRGGGDRVYHLAVPLGGAVPPLPSPAGTWTPAGAGLLAVQHNVVLVDPADPTGDRRWVGADLGVWQWDAGASTWRVLSDGLPDAAVLDLDLLASHRLLRATTYGRGVWELDLAPGPHPPVRLALRGSAADRGRPVRDGAVPPAATVAARLDASPDVLVDAPDATGRHAVPPAPTLVQLRALADRRQVAAAAPTAPVTTRVHVVVRTRAVRAGDAPVDGVRVALLLGPAGSDDTSPVTDLPAGYAAVPRDGTTVEGDGWRVVGLRAVSGLRAGRPAVASFELQSASLPPVDEAEGRRYVLLALVSHADDPFPDPSPRAVLDLLRAEPRAAARRVTVVAAGAAAGGAAPGAGDAQGPAVVRPEAVHAPGSLLVPLTTALLAHARLGDVVDQLAHKVGSRRVVPDGLPGAIAVRATPVERRVLALARAARDAQAAGPPAGVPLDRPGAGIGRFALLGALGLELPAFAGAARPASGWVATALRRGTPDPHRSRVAVPSSELPLAVAAAGTAVAGADGAARAAVTAAAHGMLAAVAAGAAVSPQLTDLLAAQTRADWARSARSDGAVAVDHHLRERFLAGAGRSSPAAWLPDAGAVPAALWDGWRTGVEQTYGLTAARPRGLPAFEAAGPAPGPLPSTARLRTGYALLLDELRGQRWPAIAWFGLLTPVLLAPSLGVLVARELPHGRAFTTAGRAVDERAVFEALVAGTTLGSAVPLVGSVLAAAALGDETEALVHAVVFGLLRAALATTALASSGDEAQDERVRWLGLALPLHLPDLYAAVRAPFVWSSSPALGTVLLLQTLPALTGLVTLGLSALGRAAGLADGLPFWLSWTLSALVLWLGAGIPLSIALADGGSWRSWVLHTPRRSPLLGSVAAAGLLPPEPLAAARVLDDSGLWPDPDAPAAGDLAGAAFPRGTTPLVRLWWEGSGALSVRYAEDLVTLRSAAGDTPVRLPAGTTAAALAQLLAAALPGVRAEVVAPGQPDPPLPWPASLDDPGVEVPVAASATARARFVPVGTSRGAALVLRHAPRADLSTRAGLAAVDPEAFPVVPTRGLGDLEGSGLGAAADLAVLLSLAAAPSLGPVTVDDGLAPLADRAVGPVVQVFRRWNLDERRLAEWQRLVAGGAPAEGPPAAAPDPLLRPPPVTPYAAQPVGADLVAAMGWIPLWRAWLRVAGDVSADGAAGFALASTPLVRFPDGAVRRPTNAELTEGVRFLLDLGAT